MMEYSIYGLLLKPAGRPSAGSSKLSAGKQRRNCQVPLKTDAYAMKKLSV